MKTRSRAFITKLLSPPLRTLLITAGLAFGVAAHAAPDTETFANSYSDYTFASSPAADAGAQTLTITGSDGKTVNGVEVLQFADRVVRVVGAGSEDTILTAYAAASPSETMLLAAGTYNLPVVTGSAGSGGLTLAKENLELRGVSRDSVVINVTGANTSREHAVLRVNAVGVAIRSLTLAGWATATTAATAGNGYQIWLNGTSANNATIDDLKFTNNNIRVSIYNGTANGLAVKNSRFEGHLYRYGIRGAGTDMMITDNVFDLSFYGSGTDLSGAIFFEYGAATSGVISGNTFKHGVGATVLPTSGAVGQFSSQTQFPAIANLQPHLITSAGLSITDNEFEFVNAYETNSTTGFTGRPVAIHNSPGVQTTGPITITGNSFMGYGYQPTNASTPTVVDSGGSQGYVLDFDGLQDLATFKMPSNIGSQGSIAAWINPTDVGSTRHSLFNGGGLEVTVRNGTIYFYPNSAQGGSLTYANNNSFTANTWTHVIVTWDLATKQTAIYFNGTQASYQSSFAPPRTTWTTAADTAGKAIFVGYDPANPGREFPGRIGSVAVFNTVLTSQQRSDVMNGTSVNTTTIPSLVAHWSPSSADSGATSIAGLGGTSTPLSLSSPVALPPNFIAVTGGSTAVNVSDNTYVTGSGLLAAQITGSSTNDLIQGTIGDDTISGGAGDDTISGGAGTNTLDGGTGIDTVTFSGSAPSSLTPGSTISVGSDQATNVEKLAFDDATIALVGTGGSEFANLTSALAATTTERLFGTLAFDASTPFSSASQLQAILDRVFEGSSVTLDISGMTPDQLTALVGKDSYFPGFTYPPVQVATGPTIKGYFPSIHEGIVFASGGDTVNVSAGVFQESSGGGDALLVNKSVTITGAGPATYNGSGQWTGGTLITRGSGAGGPALNQVVNVSGNDVTLTELTVDGRYGFDINTAQATNYGVFVSGQGFSITNAHIIDFTNSGLEFNNSNNGTVTNVSIKRTAFAPGYYAEANSGLRCVDSENLDVDDLTVENARRGIVVFQGDNSGTLDNVTIIATGTATSSGILFSTSAAPGWWNPAWGSYEGSLTFTLGGDHVISNAANGIFISDYLPTEDIALTVASGAKFNFHNNVTNGGQRANQGTATNIDAVMAAMGLTDKTAGPPDFYNYPAPTVLYVDGAWAGTTLYTEVDEHIFGYDAFATVQEAIDAAAVGATVNVAADTYTTSINVNKAVTLSGEVDGGTGAPTTIFSMAAAQTAFNVAASHVTLENLGVQQATPGTRYQSGLTLGASITNLELTNLSIDGATVGFRIGSGIDLDGLTVADSKFDNCVQGWYFAAETAASTNGTSVSNVEVSDATFNGNTQKGLYFEKLDNATFDGITVANSGVDAAYGFNNGIDINLKWQAYTNISIVNSSITGCGAYGTAPNTLFPSAVAIKARDDGATYGATPASLSNVTIDNCVISGPESALRLGEAGKTNLSPTNVIIKDSSLTGANTAGTTGYSVINETAAAVDATDGNTLNGISVATGDLFAISGTVSDAMDFTGKGLVRLKTTNVYVQSAGNLDLGIAAAAIGDVVNVQAGYPFALTSAITKNITFSGTFAINSTNIPTDSTATAVLTSFINRKGTSAVTVNVLGMNANQLAAVAANESGFETFTYPPVQVVSSSIITGYFNTIQAGVDFATAGDTINVAAGTFAENVTVNKAVTINGANAGMVAHSSGAYDPARATESILSGTFILNADNISIAGFEVTGGADAFRVSAGGQALDNISIANNYIHGTTDSPIRAGLGFGGGIGSDDWSITGNLIEAINGNARTGMVLFNIDGLTLTNNVINHTVGTSTGRRGMNLDGVLNATVTGNTVNMGLVAPTDATAASAAAPFAIQISMSDRAVENIDFSNNTVSGANRGITVLSQRDVTNATITGNTVSNVVDGIAINTGSTPPQETGVTMQVSITGNTVAAATNGIFVRDLHDAHPNGPVVLDALTVTGNTVTQGVVQIGKAETFVPSGASGPGNGLLNVSGSVTLAGSPANDTVQVEGTGNVAFESGAGSNSFIGGAGTDSAVFAGNSADYTIAFSGANVVVTQTSGGSSIDTLTKVEVLQFADNRVIPLGSATGSIFNTISSAANGANNDDLVVVEDGFPLILDTVITKDVTFSGTFAINSTNIPTDSTATAVLTSFINRKGTSPVTADVVGMNANQLAAVVANESGLYLPDIAVEEPVNTGLTDGASTVAFGRTFLDHPVPNERTFTIRNAGNYILTGISVSFTGADADDFSVTSAPDATLAVGASTTVTVKFAPTVAANQTATMHVSSSDHDESSFDIALTGRGAIASAGLAFDGGDDYLTIQPDADFNPADRKFTVEGWVKPASGMSPNAPLWSTEVNRGDLQVRTGNLNRFSFNVLISGSVITVVSPSDWVPGTWYHVAGTVDGEVIRLYVNGVEVAATAYTGTWNTDVGARFIGGNAAGNRFKGTLDEVRFWNYARNCAEVAQSYVGELTGAEDGLVAYYKFNEGEASADNSDVFYATDSANDGDHEAELFNFQLNAGNSTSNYITPGAVTSHVLAPVPMFGEINLKGNSLTIARGDTTPSLDDHTDFGTVHVQVARTFRIENLGNIDLAISDIALSGPNAADFDLDNIPTVVPGGQFAEFTVTIEPSSGESRYATVTVNSDDCDEPVYAFDIQSTPSILIATTGGEIVIDEKLDTGSTFAVTQGTAGTIRVNAAGRNFSIDGGAETSASSGNISLTGVNSVTVNGGQGSDVINIGGITGLPGLVVDGGNGTDTINFNGDITLTGALEVGDTNETVNVLAGANVSTSGTAGIDIEVTRTVTLASGGSLETVNGDISISANQQATATSGDFDGIDVNGGLIRTTGNGAVTLTGRGGDASGGNQAGVRVQNGGDVDGGTTSALIITGTGGSSSAAGNHGVVVTGSGSTVLADGAPITITGIEGAGTNGLGIAMLANGALNTNGALTLVTDSLNFSTTATGFAGTSATLVQRTDGVLINLGVTTDIVGGPLNLSDAELDRISTPILNIGDVDSGGITQTSPIHRVAATAMNLVTGGDIAVNSPSINTTGGNLSLNPGGAGAGTVTASAFGVDLITGAGGAVSFGSGDQLAIAINSAVVDSGYTQLNVTGQVNLTGAALLLSGTHTPLPGQIFTIIKNDGTDDVIGAFAGLAEGATMPLNGVNVAISYEGGDGNDVTLAYAAPVLTVVATVKTVAEGSPVANNGTFNDLQGDVVNFSASLGAVTKDDTAKTWAWSYTPPDGPAGPTVVTITATDAGGSANTTTFNLSVTNVAPVAVSQTGINAVSVLEDSTANLITLASTDAGVNDTATYSVITKPLATKGVLNPNPAVPFTLAGNTLTFTPVANATGATSFTFRATDNNGAASAAAGTVAIDIVPVNDAPSFALRTNLPTSFTHPSGFTTAQTVTGWAVSVTDGDAEAVQALTFNVSQTSGPAMFTDTPATTGSPAIINSPRISSNGTLSYRTNGTAGTATFSVVLSDNGDNANGGVNVSAPATFSITVAEDSTPPAVTVTAPAASAILNESPSGVTVTGTATDNKAVTSVEIVLNNGAPIVLNSFVTGLNDGTTSRTFSRAITPVAGTNTIKVKSFDAAGNSSPEVTRTFTYKVLRTFAVTVTPAGFGTITYTPALVSGKAQIGTTYTLKATPAANRVFNMWTTTPTPTASPADEATTLVVTMTADLAVTANFMNSPFTAGNYTGLARAATGVTPSANNVGRFEGMLANTGIFTGKANFAGTTTNFTATFHPTTGNATGSVAGLMYDLTLDLENGTDKVTGTVTTSAGVSDVDADRAVFSTTNLVPPQYRANAASAKYNVVFPAKTQTPPVATTDYPQGYGFGTLTLTSAGVGTFTGTLADNTAVTTYSAPLSKNYQWPLAIIIKSSSITYGTTLAGMVELDPFQDDTDLAATDLDWFRSTFAAAKYYPLGWPAGIKVDAIGAIYNASTTAQNSLGLGAPDPTTNAKLTFFEGGLSSAFEINGLKIVGNTVTEVPASTSFSLVVTPSTGGFTGTVAPGSPVTNNSPFKGTILQKGANKGGYGHFLNNTTNLGIETGGVTLGNP